jgi:hypothetical protein
LFCADVGTKECAGERHNKRGHGSKVTAEHLANSQIPVSSSEFAIGRLTKMMTGLTAAIAC